MNNIRHFSKNQSASGYVPVGREVEEFNAMHVARRSTSQVPPQFNDAHLGLPPRQAPNAPPRNVSAQSTEEAEKKGKRNRHKQTREEFVGIHTADNRHVMRQQPAFDMNKYMKERFGGFESGDPQPIYTERMRSDTELGYREIMFTFDSIDGTNDGPGLWLFQSDSRERNFVNLEELNNIVGMEVFEFYMPKFSTSLGLKEVTMQIVSLEAQAIKNSDNVRTHFSFKLQDDGDRYLLTPRRSKYLFNNPINYTTSIQFQFRDPINLIRFPAQSYTGSVSLLANPVFTTDTPHTLTNTDIISLPSFADQPPINMMLTNVASQIGALGAANPIDVDKSHASLFITGNIIAQVFKDTNTNDIGLMYGTISGTSPNEIITWSALVTNSDGAGTFSDMRADYGNNHILVGVLDFTSTSIFFQGISTLNAPAAPAFGAVTASPGAATNPTIDSAIDFYKTVGGDSAFVVTWMSDNLTQAGIVQLSGPASTLTQPGPFATYSLKSFVATPTNQNIAIDQLIIGDWLLVFTMRIVATDKINVYAQASRLNFPINTGIDPNTIVVSPTAEYTLDSHTWATTGFGNVSIDSVVLNNGATPRALVAYATGLFANTVLVDVDQTTGVINVQTSSHNTIIDFLRSPTLATVVSNLVTAGSTTEAATALGTSAITNIIGFIEQGMSLAEATAAASSAGIASSIYVTVLTEYYGPTTSVSLYKVSDTTAILYFNHTPTATPQLTPYIQSIIVTHATNTITEASNSVITTSNPTAADPDSRLIISKANISGTRVIMTSYSDTSVSGINNAVAILGNIENTNIRTSDEDLAGYAIANAVANTNTFEIIGLNIGANIAAGATSLPLVTELATTTAQVLTRRMRILMKFDTLVRGFTNGIQPVRL